MTKSETISLLRKRLSGGTDITKRFHERDIEAALTKVYSQLMNNTYRVTPDKVDQFTKEYPNVSVLQDATTERYYSDLPASIIPISDAQSGVRFIGPKTGINFDFIPVSRKEWTLHNSTEGGSISTNTFYIVEDNKVIYSNITAALISAGVRMSLLVQWDEWDEDDNVLIPGAREDEFIKMSTDYLLGTPLTDLNNK